MRVCFFERNFGRMLERVSEREREKEEGAVYWGRSGMDETIVQPFKLL